MYDAIVVFGGGITHDGILEENTRVRVAYAVAQWKAKAAPLLVFSGGWSFNLAVPPTRTEAEGMAEYAGQMGVPPEVILREEQSRDTLGNALFVKTLFALPRGWRNLLVVVAEYHAWRTTQICNFVFGSQFQIQVVGVPLPMSVEEQRERVLRERASWHVLTEVFTMPAGDHEAIEQCMRQYHPGYAAQATLSHEQLTGRIAEYVERLRTASGDLSKRVVDIVRDAAALKDKYTTEHYAPVNYACVFCQSDVEYNRILEAAGGLGFVIEDTPTGPLFKIVPLETVAGSLQLLKVRKPDPNRTERGDADFTVSDFTAFKDSVVRQPGFSLIKRPTFEMIELAEAGGEVLAYFSHPPLDEQHDLLPVEVREDRH